MHLAPKPKRDRLDLAPPEPIEPLLTVRDMARILGRSPHAVRQLYERGRLPPAIRVGRLLTWEPRDIREWMDRRKG